MIYQYSDAMERRKELFRKYMKELNTMMQKPMTEEEIENEVCMQLNSPDIEWVDICFASEIIGFMIIGLNEACHPHADRYIINMYVVPAHRRQHLGSSAVRQYISRHPGRYCLDILEPNTAAQTFWCKTFIRNGYEPFSIPYIAHNEDKNAVMYAWRKQEG